MEQKKHSVLLIEDDKMDQMAFERFMKSDEPPFTYKIADSVSEAKRKLECEQFDIIVSDYSLGDGTALDILEMVKDKPIILITGISDEQVAIEAWRAGAYDYLPKDHDRNYLKALPKAIENAISRKRIEDALDRKQRNLEAIFDAAPVGMLLVDENMVITRVNDAVRQMLHRDYSQIINRRIGDALACINSAWQEKGCGHSPACPDCSLQKAVRVVLNSGKSIRNVLNRSTLEIDLKDTIFWLRVSAEPVIIDGHKHVVLAIEDFTENKRAEEKLKETMELKSQFISTVSHELRTPLAAIKEGVAIVLDEVTGPINEGQRKFLDIVKRNTERLSSLINNVLDFQKLRCGNTILNIQKNDVGHVLSDLHDTMALYAKKNGVALSVDWTAGLPMAEFDCNMIIQILTNLVSNAIKFTPPKGRVSVNARQIEDELIFEIRDTGMGIPKEALSKIFERFYRVKRPGKEIQGTGLGLAIVHNIVMMHGGRIEVESEIDQGTTFTVFLPLKAKPPKTESSTQKDEFLESSIAG